MKVATPAGDDSYAKRYTRRPDAASATRGTHDKLTSKDPLSNGLRAFATRFSFCLSPPSHGGNVPKPLMFLKLLATNTVRDDHPCGSVRLVCDAGGRLLAASLIELPVKRGAADFQSAGDLGHLSAIMGDRKADDFALHFFERAHFA